MSNEELVNLIKSGTDSEGEKMLELYNQTIGILFRICKGLMISQGLEEDIKQEYFIWLCEAINNYDSSYNVKFASYLFECIRGKAISFIQEQTVCRIPSYKHDEIREYKRQLRMLSQILNREPSEKELASFMGISVSKINKLKADSQKGYITSLNDVNEEGFELIDNIADKVNYIEEVNNRLDIEYRNKELWRLVTNETHLSEEDITNYYNGSYSGDKALLRRNLYKGISQLRRQPGRLKKLSILSDINFCRGKGTASFHRDNSSVVEDIVFWLVDKEEKREVLIYD